MRSLWAGVVATLFPAGCTYIDRAICRDRELGHDTLIDLCADVSVVTFIHYELTFGSVASS